MLTYFSKSCFFFLQDITSENQYGLHGFVDLVTHILDLLESPANMYVFINLTAQING